MPKPEQHKQQYNSKPANLPLAFFACPNSECADFNHFRAGNLSIAEWMGKDKVIRRLYCKTCGHRFSEREGSLMQYNRGNLLKVSSKALFGTKKEIVRRIQDLGIGQKINTSHMKRLNGTIRGRQARLIRRTRSGSHRQEMLQYSIWLWRDLYNWTRVHYSLLDETPAMALCLTDEAWTVLKYILYPVHVSDFQRRDWPEQRNSVLESAVDAYKRNKALPIS